MSWRSSQSKYTLTETKQKWLTIPENVRKVMFMTRVLLSCCIDYSDWLKISARAAVFPYVTKMAPNARAKSDALVI